MANIDSGKILHWGKEKRSISALQTMFLELKFSFIFKDSRTISTLTKHPSCPSEYWSNSSRLPVRVIFIFLCSSNVLSFTCLFCISPKHYFLCTKSFKDCRLWHHLSFPKHWLFWAQYFVHSAEVLLISPRWKHYWVICRNLKTKAGPEVAWDYSWENCSAVFLFLPRAIECLLNHSQKI